MPESDKLIFSFLYNYSCYYNLSRVLKWLKRHKPENHFRSGSELKLVTNQLIIGPSQVSQFFVVALLNDFTSINYNDVVCVHYRTESVGYDYNRTAVEKFLQALHYQEFAIGIQCSSGFIKKDVVWIFIYGSGDKDALLLPLA